VGYPRDATQLMAMMPLLAMKEPKGLVEREKIGTLGCSSTAEGANGRSRTRSPVACRYLVPQGLAPGGGTVGQVFKKSRKLVIDGGEEATLVFSWLYAVRTR